jgi:TetR/AcrR family transcriptional repressor of nem operon
MSNVRDRLIESTFQEVFTKGYNGASLASILNTAEVKKGAMYHYFPSKKAMVIAMIDEVVAKNRKKKWEKIVNTQDNIIDTLIEFIKDVNNWNLTDGCPLGNLLQESLDYDKDFINTLTLILNTWKEELSNILLKAQELQQIKEDINIQECSSFIIASIEGALLISKKYEKTDMFDSCMNQLSVYINTLRYLKK